MRRGSLRGFLHKSIAGSLACALIAPAPAIVQAAGPGVVARTAPGATPLNGMSAGVAAVGRQGAGIRLPGGVPLAPVPSAGASPNVRAPSVTLPPSAIPSRAPAVRAPNIGAGSFAPRGSRVLEAAAPGNVGSSVLPRLLPRPAGSRAGRKVPLFQGVKAFARNVREAAQGGGEETVLSGTWDNAGRRGASAGALAGSALGAVRRPDLLPASGGRSAASRADVPAADWSVKPGRTVLHRNLPVLILPGALLMLLSTPGKAAAAAAGGVAASAPMPIGLLLTAGGMAVSFIAGRGVYKAYRTLDNVPAQEELKRYADAREMTRLYAQAERLGRTGAFGPALGPREHAAAQELLRTYEDRARKLTGKKDLDGAVIAAHETIAGFEGRYYAHRHPWLARAARLFKRAKTEVPPPAPAAQWKGESSARGQERSFFPEGMGPWMFGLLAAAGLTFLTPDAAWAASNAATAAAGQPFSHDLAVSAFLMSWFLFEVPFPLAVPLALMAGVWGWDGFFLALLFAFLAPSYSALREENEKLKRENDDLRRAVP